MVTKNSSAALTSTAPIGYGATDLQQAYGLTHAPSGTETVAIIDAGATPKLADDLATYRAQYGLPPCTVASGCFRQENYLGAPAYQPDPANADTEEQIGVETALDVEMASATCPQCKITEIQVPLLDGAPASDAAVDTATRHFSIAVKLAHSQGARAASISYGYPSDKSTDSGVTAMNMNQPGLAIYASTGDSAYNGPNETWPANLPTVIAAGGTSLYHSSTSSTGYAETAWSGGAVSLGLFALFTGAGSGCAPDLPAANGQPLNIAAACGGHRASSDISAVADPFTGVAVYDTYAPETGQPADWITVGGTSVAAPLLAGMNARAGVQSDLNGPNYLYRAPVYTFNDVTLGSNAYPGSCAADGYSDSVCVAGDGWDGPTGLGTPQGLAPFYRY